MIGPGHRNPAGGHVGVSDRLDLLDPVAGGERIPAREHAVQQRHQIRRGQPVGQRREADDVREQHGDVRRSVRDDSLPLLQTLRHGLG